MSPRTTKTTADLVAASILLAAMAAVTACSASPSPNPSPPAAPTAAQTSTGTSLAASTPTATPSPTATWPPQMALPTPPPEMSRDDEAGAIAAAKHFLDLYSYTESTQDTSAWEAMSHPDCVTCKSVLADVATHAARNQIVVSPPMATSELTADQINPLTFAIYLNAAKEPDEIWTADGHLVSKNSDRGGKLRVLVVWQDSRWCVRAMTAYQPAPS